jgi:hypothetical protein
MLCFTAVTLHLAAAPHLADGVHALLIQPLDALPDGALHSAATRRGSNPAHGSSGVHIKAAAADRALASSVPLQLIPTPTCTWKRSDPSGTGHPQACGIACCCSQ